jgi:hypothetical protein
MFRILVVAGILATPYLWDDAVHATGVKRGLWIIGGLAVICCAVILVVEVVRLSRSQKITLHPAAVLQPANNSSIPVEADLANAVADCLDAGNDLAYGHPYYCGMGLIKYGENYVYASVQDGEVTTPKYGKAFYEDVERERAKVFGSRGALVEWLSVQTNSSLYGDGNQSITLKRLQSFASFVGRGQARAPDKGF